MKPTPAELKALHSLVPSLIKEAGAFARKEFEVFSAHQIEYKGKNNMFSYVDVRTEEILKEGLAKILPGSGYINEESDDQEGETEFTWIIDPIDGTTNFIHGLPLFSICVALKYKQELLLGYIYEVVHDEMFAAVQGGGATLNEKPISVSDTPTLSGSLMATGFPYRQGPRFEEFLRVVVRVLKETHGMRRLGSAAIDLAYVACGRIEGFFELGLNAWDVAAGALIVQEAGGRVTDFKGGNDYIFGRQLVATNKHIHDEVQAILADLVI